MKMQFVGLDTMRFSASSSDAVSVFGVVSLKLNISEILRIMNQKGRSKRSRPI